MEKDLVTVPLPALDAEIMAYNNGADEGILVERDTSGSIKKLKKRFDKINKGLRRLQAAMEGPFGDSALGGEIEASAASLMARFDMWTTWPQAPLPNGGVGLRAIDAVKKLWLLTKEAGGLYAAFQLRAEEHQRAVDAHMATAKKPRGGARAGGAPTQRAASQPRRGGVLVVKAKPSDILGGKLGRILSAGPNGKQSFMCGKLSGKLSGSKRQRPEEGGGGSSGVCDEDGSASAAAVREGAKGEEGEGDGESSSLTSGSTDSERIFVRRGRRVTRATKSQKKQKGK
jgi:hypothetical protein